MNRKKIDPNEELPKKTAMTPKGENYVIYDFKY